jgi:beta-glucosidase
MAEKFFQFPRGFVWGAGTAAYQIEGATERDGRSESIWDKFCRQPGVIEEGASGEPACRHYDLWKEDIALIKSLGLKSYRLSIAWPRILPAGRGPVNEKGLAFYEGLIDGLLAEGIVPNITLYHWDLPQALEDEGGWANRATAQAFADYAAVVLKRLGDRPCQWTTFNEPWCVATLGYKTGTHAPGRKENDKTYNNVIHNILLAHGLAVLAIRRHSKLAQVGIVIVPATPWPATSKPEDVNAADQNWQLENDWWMQPLLSGSYPESVWKWKGANVPDLQPGDMEAIHQPLDFLGLNFYFPTRIQADPAATPLAPSVVKPAGVPTTSMPGWEIFPPIAEMVLVEFSRRYPKIPIYVTENGAAFEDPKPDAQGHVHDPQRLDFIRNHLAYAHRALEQGVDLRGWYVWTLMDNFEWRFGYGKRFGIHYVDYTTFQRFLKDSGLWYRQVIADNGFMAEDPAPCPSPYPARLR